MICASCGTENRAGSKFCDNCGSALAATCPHCGEPNRGDARFCANCGGMLATDTRAPSPTPAAPSPARDAERRLVSVLFTDLVGFTTIAEDRDPEAVRELLSTYFESATRIVELHGGTVEKFIGDAVMAVWGTPVAHEDDAERAVRAALEMVDAVKGLDPDLQARAGVLTGEAAVNLNALNQGMVAGDLVNTAARLQGVAEPGTVLVGEATRRAAERSIVFDPLGDHSLKGKTAPIPAWRALRVVANRGGEGRGSALEPPFVGREEELRELKDALHAVGRDRRVRLVSITGPGGIGKSRLVWELEKYVDGVAEDIYWHRGRSPSYGEGVTFWALGEMVRRRCDITEDADAETTRERVAAAIADYLPDASERERVGAALMTLLGVEDAPAGGREALFPAWRTFFERIAERGTTVLVFEDLQWADTGLLDFIDHVLDWTRDLPIMVVTLARPELFDRRPDWAANRRHLTALALERLTDADMRDLLNGLVPGLPDDVLGAIVGRAEGMPLYAVETVRGLMADGRIERSGDTYVPVGDLSTIRVPESLRSLIASRLDGLDPADRSLLQDAAVLGQAFATDALAAVNGVSAADLEPRLRDLTRRELLEVERDPRSPERGQYKFVQSLIREVAYGTLARRDRRSRHLAVARHFESVGDEELAGALASHYLAAREASDDGPEADAVSAQARLALVAAADRAAALGGFDQAVRFLDQALTITTDPADRAPLLDRAARSAVAAASPESERYAQAAVEAYEAIGDRVAAAGATARLGKVLIDGGSMLRASEVLEAAVPTAEEIGDEPVLAETLAYQARASMRRGQAAEAVAQADRALAIAERLNLDHVVAEAFVNKGGALSTLGRRREAVALGRAALDLAQSLPDRSLEMRIRNNYASSLFDDDPAESTRVLEEALDLARDLGDRGMYNWILGTTGAARYAEGHDWDEQALLMREALDVATIPADRARLRTLLGLIETSRGEHVAELLDELQSLIGDSTDPDDRFSLQMTITHAATLSRDFEGAWRAGMAAYDAATQGFEVPLIALGHVVAWARDLDRARVIAPLAANVPSSGSANRAYQAAVMANVPGLEGRTQEALALYRLARDELLRLGQGMDAALVVIDAAHVLPGEPEVRQWAAEVRPLLEELRARPYLERLDAVLAEAPAKPATPAVERTLPIQG